MAKLAAVRPEVQDNESQIRERIFGFAEAFRARDLNRMMSYYAPDIVSFDMMPPLKYQGIDAFRKSWEKGLSMMEGPIEFFPEDVHITAGDDVAFCHAFDRMSFTSEGQKMEMRIRWTGCLRKINGNWLVTHEHVSVPIDMNTDKALYDLKS